MPKFFRFISDFPTSYCRVFYVARALLQVTKSRLNRLGSVNLLIAETTKLNFSFGSKKILHDVNLSIPAGSIYCFLGPNGAGKTTTLRLLLGLLKAGRHQISIFGQELFSNRRSILHRIGCLIEQPSLYQHLTGRENLEIYRLSYLCDKKRPDEVLNIVGLQYAREQGVKTYSLGMKQRLAIAIALLNDPEFLILDEPTNGLDPEGIIEIRQLIKKLNFDFQKTILISSHLLSEVEKIATHFAIIHKGHMLFQGRRDELQKLNSNLEAVELETTDNKKALVLLEPKFQIKKNDHSGIRIDNVNKEQIPLLIELLVKENIGIYRVGVTQNSLEEIFIEMVS